MNIQVLQAGRKIRNCGGDPEKNRDGCGGSIEALEIIARAIWWSNKKRWERSWHFDCWIRAKRDWVEANPRSITAGNPNGRIRKDLTPEERKRRLSLLSSASQLRKRRLEQTTLLYSQGWMDEFYQRADKFNHKLQQIWDNLLEVGGPPHKSFVGWVGTTTAQPEPESKSEEDLEWDRKLKSFQEKYL